MTTWKSADGTVYQRVTAQSVSRAIANLDRGYMRREGQMPYGFTVDTAEGWVRATSISNGDFSSEFCSDLFNAGFDYAVEADGSNWNGDYVVALRINGRRVAKAGA